jgi:hypothetical protein
MKPIRTEHAVVGAALTFFPSSFVDAHSRASALNAEVRLGRHDECETQLQIWAHQG